MLSRKVALPFQVCANVDHQSISAFMAAEMRMWWWREDTVVDASMRRRRKMRLAGIAFAANASFPIKERMARLVQVRAARIAASS